MISKALFVFFLSLQLPGQLSRCEAHDNARLLLASVPASYHNTDIGSDHSNSIFYMRKSLRPGTNILESFDDAAQKPMTVADNYKLHYIAMTLKEADVHLI